MKNWKLATFIVLSATLVLIYFLLKFNLSSIFRAGYIFFGCTFWLLYLLGVQNSRLKQIQLAYKEKRELLNDIFVYTPDLIYYKNLKSEITGCNESFCNFFEVKMEDMKGKTSFEFFSEEDNKKILEHETFVFNNNKVIQYEIVLNHGTEGDKRYMQVTKVPMRDEFNNIIGLSSFCRDITEVKNREKEKINFNAALTHDLKTPILAQTKALEILESEQLGSINEEQKTLIKETIYSAKLVQEMINSIIYVSKLEMNSYKFNFEYFKVENIVLENIEKMQSIAANKNISITLKTEPKMNGTIHADKFLIERVICNLILNALTCSNENSNIDIVISSDDSILKLIIQNKTIKSKMTKEKLEKIFDKYAVYNQKFRQIGTGLGMNLAKEIIVAHGGEIFADVIKAQHESYDICEFGFKLENVNIENPSTVHQQNSPQIQAKIIKHIPVLNNL